MAGYETMTAQDEVAVTPSNTVAVTSSRVPGVYRALWVGGAGAVTIKTPYGDTVEHKSVPAGTILPVQGTHVTTATTATFIVAWF